VRAPPWLTRKELRKEPHQNSAPIIGALKPARIIRALNSILIITSLYLALIIRNNKTQIFILLNQSICLFI
jgi:hypothetical protein